MLNVITVCTDFAYLVYIDIVIGCLRRGHFGRSKGAVLTFLVNYLKKILKGN